MQKNRYFSTILGFKPEILIAAAIDADGTAVVGVAATSVNTLTIASTPTAGSIITFNVNDIPYTYTTPASGNSAAASVVGILAALNTNSQGFTATASGTTSATVTLTANATGTALNGTTVEMETSGTGYSALVPANFAGGVTAASTPPQPTFALFESTAIAGAIWAYWADTKLALVAGDTALAANRNRQFFYALKNSDNTARISTPINCETREYSSAAYNAGTASVGTLTVAGTISNGQFVHAKIIDTTSSDLPYNSYEYVVEYGKTYGATTASSNDNVATILAALINAETADPIVTATSSTNVVTVTASLKTTTFKLLMSLEITPTQTTDASTLTPAITVKSVAPIGDYASMKELEKAQRIMTQGGSLYGNEIAESSEFYTANSNLIAATQYGILIVKDKRTQPGLTQVANRVHHTLVAVANAGLSALAAL